MDLGRTTWLRVNKNKSNVVIFNSKAQLDEIKDIKVAHDMKYLSITKMSLIEIC